MSEGFDFGLSGQVLLLLISHCPGCVMMFSLCVLLDHIYSYIPSIYIHMNCVVVCLL